MAVILLSLLVTARGVAAVTGDPPMSDAALVRAQTRWLLDQIDAGAPERMQQLFPEGYLFTVVLTGLALTADPAAGDDAAAAGTGMLALADSPLGTAPFAEVDSPRFGAFHSGWTLLLAAQNARVEAGPGPVDPVVAEALRRRAEPLLQALAGSDTGLLESYPGQTWPCDTVVAVAALHEASRVVPLPGLDEVTARWLGQMEAIRDPASGLLPHRTTPQGQVLQGPRATSQSIIQAFWPTIVGRRQATADWLRFRRTFVDRRLGVTAVREYPLGAAGSGDVDSGPLVLGLSASASVVTLAAARAHGDHALASDLDRAAELVGGGVTVLGRRCYAGCQLAVGDAFLAWARTRAWGDPALGGDADYPRPRWVVPLGIVATPGVLSGVALGLLVARSSRRSRSSRAGTVGYADGAPRRTRV